MFYFKNKKYNFYVLSILVIGLLSYLAYYLLLRDNFLHTSISSIIGSSTHMVLKRHLFVLGVLPVYIAVVIFGTGILSVYLVRKIEAYFAYFRKHRSDVGRKNNLRNLLTRL